MCMSEVCMYRKQSGGKKGGSVLSEESVGNKKWFHRDTISQEFESCQ